jgi:nucleoside-diphosphate kinase
MQNSTLAIVKPHILQQGISALFMANRVAKSSQAGSIVDAIAAKFTISAVHYVTLDRVNAEEFLEVYKTVVPEYHVPFSPVTDWVVDGGRIDGRTVLGTGINGP